MQDQQNDSDSADEPIDLRDPTETGAASTPTSAAASDATKDVSESAHEAPPENLNLKNLISAELQVGTAPTEKTNQENDSDSPDEPIDLRDAAETGAASNPTVTAVSSTLILNDVSESPHEVHPGVSTVACVFVGLVYLH